MTLLDMCIEGFLEFFAEWPGAENTMLVFTSTRGFPLGEHRRVGPCDEAIYGELVQVPLIIHVPEENAAGIRGRSLVYPCDLYTTLLDWFAVPEIPAQAIGESLLDEIRRGETAGARPCLPERSGRPTRHSHARVVLLRKSSELELFAKPDDRWEVNNVSDRCLDIAEELQAEIPRYLEHLNNGTLTELPELSAVLREGLE